MCRFWGLRAEQEKRKLLSTLTVLMEEPPPAVQLCSDNQWCMLEYPNIGCIGLDAPSTQPKKFHPDPSIQKEANNATNIANFDWLIRNGLKFTRTWTALLLSHIHTEAENVSMLFKSR